MKITALYVYPIKGLRGIPLERAQLGPQGIKHDRTFMLYHIYADGSRKKMQLSGHPECSLFDQEIRDGKIVVQYNVPTVPLVPASPLQETALEVSLEPEMEGLEKVEMEMYNSGATVYRMGEKYEEWFTACFGFPTMLIYIGDGRRPVLGTISPKAQQALNQKQSWLSSITSNIASPAAQPPADWLTFTDVSPFLVTSEASLAEVSSRLPPGDVVPMFKFRPNIVVTGEAQYDEDFWGELALRGAAGRLLLTANCARCSSINVDYETGRAALGEKGTVLKKLMRDRRVDPGNKWSPVFGRYGFLADGGELTVAVGDDIDVTRRNAERTVWDWPLKTKVAAT